MISNNKYDYIICGGGASGLLLSNALISDSFFDNKKILIAEGIKLKKFMFFRFRVW